MWLTRHFKKESSCSCRCVDLVNKRTGIFTSRQSLVFYWMCLCVMKQADSHHREESNSANFPLFFLLIFISALWIAVQMSRGEFNLFLNTGRTIYSKHVCFKLPRTTHCDSMFFLNRFSDHTILLLVIYIVTNTLL